ncbi:hypothetical protein GALLR39Z86_30470 [Glycomyces algeriensis]|uniref:Uncharacterized protein n=1 Tax=Glycomyces algeriensis TaxID=256037 RepID=A0A9W6LGP1_9ACTN|nr:hypothetical protein GALLR39Z86_30470 [Glycomyces algeriensis]
MQMSESFGQEPARPPPAPAGDAVRERPCTAVDTARAGDDDRPRAPLPRWNPLGAPAPGKYGGADRSAQADGRATLRRSY